MWLVLATGGLGLIIGSFLNVVIWRVPRGESVVAPPSACPACGQPIRSYDNIPVLSWLLLRGRCRDCRAPISARYPLIEAGTGVLFATMAWRFGLAWDLPAYLYLAALAVALSMIDIDVRRLPNVIVLPSYLIAGLLLVLPAVMTGHWDDYRRAWLAAVALFAFFFAIAFVYPAGMGFGDVKLSGVLGLYLGWLGWGPVVVGTFLAFLLGAVLGVIVMLSASGNRKTAIPFGPFLMGGALLAIWFGEAIADAYLSTVIG